MKNRNIIYVLNAITIILFLTGCRGLLIVKCSDGNPYGIERMPEKKFQQYGKTFSTKAKAVVDVLDVAKVHVNTDTKTEIIELRQKLDNFSSRFQDNITAAYDVVRLAPCDKNARDKYLVILDGFNKENFALEKLKTEIDTALKSIMNQREIRIKEAIETYNNDNGEKALQGFSNFNNENEKLRNQLNEYSVSLKKTTSEIELKNKAIKELQSQAKTQATILDSLTIENQLLYSKLSIANDRITFLNTNSNDVNSSANTLEKEKKSLQSQLAKANDRITLLNANTSETNNNLKELGKEKELLLNQFEKVKADNLALKTSNNILQITADTYLSACRVLELLHKIETTNSISSSESTELLKNIAVIEVAYRNKRDCEVAPALIQYLNYYLELNESKPEMRETVNQFVKLKQDILNTCNN